MEQHPGHRLAEDRPEQRATVVLASTAADWRGTDDLIAGVFDGVGTDLDRT